MKQSSFDPFEFVEAWVIMAALENFPREQVLSWTWSQWLDFYERIGIAK